MPMNQRKYNKKKANKITLTEKNKLLKDLSTNIINTYPTIDFSYSNLMMKLYNCNFFRVNIKKDSEYAIYKYKEKAVFFSNDMNIDASNENILHECIYFLQDKRDKKNKLNRIGLCEIGNIKIRGLGLNEAAIQYIVGKMLDNQENKSHMQSLLKQLIYLTGEKVLVESTLKSKNDFKEKVMTKLNDDKTYYLIEENFDKMFEIEQKITNTKNMKQREKLKNELRNTFLKAQEMLYKRYFEHLLTIIDSKEQADMYIQILEEYQKNILNDGIWFEFKEQEIANVDKILYEINKRREREGMIKWKENKFIKLFNKLVNLKQKDYENEIK